MTDRPHELRDRERQQQMKEETEALWTGYGWTVAVLVSWFRLAVLSECGVGGSGEENVWSRGTRSTKSKYLRARESSEWIDSDGKRRRGRGRERGRGRVERLENNSPPSAGGSTQAQLIL